MIRGNRRFTTANTAIVTALLCGTPSAFAQETATAPEAQIVAPPPMVATQPAATPVAPPPAVPTITAAPAASPAAREPVRQRAAAKPAARPTARALPAAAPVASPVSEAPASEPTVINAPTLDATTAVTATVEDTAPVAPVGQFEATPIADDTSEEWMIYGGLGAALGLAGLAGMMAARRRRTRVSDDPTTVAPNMAVATPAPRPLPVQQIAAPIERFTAPIARQGFADAHLPPVTDPLFAHRPVLGPVTDPLFFQTVAMPPVTDPMFAGTDQDVGGSSAAAAFSKRRDWQSPSNEERKPLHEFEPAE